MNFVSFCNRTIHRFDFRTQMVVSAAVGFTIGSYGAEKVASYVAPRLVVLSASLLPTSLAGFVGVSITLGCWGGQLYVSLLASRCFLRAILAILPGRPFVGSDLDLSPKCTSRLYDGACNISIGWLAGEYTLVLFSLSFFVYFFASVTALFLLYVRLSGLEELSNRHPLLGVFGARITFATVGSCVLRILPIGWRYSFAIGLCATLCERLLGRRRFDQTTVFKAIDSLLALVAADLPRQITIQGDLVLDDRYIARLPENGLLGNLMIRRCSGLTRLPRDIFQIEEGRSHFVLASGSSLSAGWEEGLAAVGNVLPPMEVCDTLEDQIYWWASRTQKEVLSAIRVPQSWKEKWRRDLGQFLSKLSESAECRAAENERNLALRICKILTWMFASKEHAEIGMREIEDSITSCADRTILATDVLIQKIEIDELREQGVDRKKLLECAQGYFRLEAVDQAAATYVLELPPAERQEAIEVSLYFRITLRNRLNLPIFTQAMLYSRVFDQPSAQYMEQVAKSIETRSDQAFRDFLVEWGPWEVERRREADACVFEALSETKRVGKPPICPLCFCPIEQEVLWHNTSYEFELLKGCYVVRGKDDQGRLIDLSLLERVTRTSNVV